MISSKAIQLQFLLNHSSFRERLSISTNTIDNNPHGNIKKEEGLVDGDMMKSFYKRER